MDYTNHDKKRLHAHMELLIMDTEQYDKTKIEEIGQILRLQRDSSRNKIVAGVRYMTAFVTALLMCILLVVWFPLKFLHNTILKGFAQLMLLIIGIDVIIEDADNLNEQARLVFYSHTTNVDGFVLGSCIEGLRGVGKKSLFQVPVFGWVLKAYGNIAIDRKNLTKAIQSLKDAAVMLEHRSDIVISIAPEGTRSKTGHVLDFKKGPFHLASEWKLSFAPVLIHNAYECLCPGSPLCHSGTVRVRFLPIMESNSEHETLRKDTRRAMLKALSSGSAARTSSRLFFKELYFVVVPLIVTTVFTLYYVYSLWQ